MQHTENTPTERTLMGSTTLLRARVELAGAIVTAARAHRDEAAARPATVPNRSLYEGCVAELAQREAEATRLRGELIRAEAGR